MEKEKLVFVYVSTKGLDDLKYPDPPSLLMHANQNADLISLLNSGYVIKSYQIAGAGVEASVYRKPKAEFLVVVHLVKET